MFTGFKG